jgi:predicted RNase H-like nuclease (RuvC/YqgF family)
VEIYTTLKLKNSLANSKASEIKALQEQVERMQREKEILLHKLEEREEVIQSLFHYIEEKKKG